MYYFVCKVKSERIDNDGLNKSVTESFLLEAESHANAENRIIEQVAQFSEGAVEVISVKKVKIGDIFGFENKDGDKFYKVKVAFISFDEDRQIEKRKVVTSIVMSDSCENALKEIKAGLSGSMSEYVITGIDETPIIDFFPYEETTEKAFYDDDPQQEDNIIK